MEFSRLAKAGRRGFTLSGSGSATVTTPAVYPPRDTFAVTIRGKTRPLKSSRRGRLRIAVPLGRGNAAQQFTAGVTTRVFRASVKIR
jgi:hypothetical protein